MATETAQEPAGVRPTALDAEYEEVTTVCFTPTHENAPKQR